MAQTVTVSSLITKVRQRANMENSTFVTDSEIVGYLNDSYKKLWGLLIATSEDYALSSTTIAVVGGTDTYNLPSDFYKLKAFDYPTTAGVANVKRFMFSQRNKFKSQTLAALFAPAEAPYRYHLQGSQVRFIPVPTGTASVTIWYHPTASTLVASSPGAGEVASFDAVNGFDLVMILDAAIQCLLKEESDPSGLMVLQEKELERIKKEMKTRDEGAPPTVVDVYGSGEWC